MELNIQEKLVLLEVTSSSFNPFKSFITADKQEHGCKDLIKSRL